MTTGPVIVAMLALLPASHSPAPAQPPAVEIVVPEVVCLTNACGPARKPLGSFMTVRDAIGAGHGEAVRRLGGTPTDVMQALQERLLAEMGRGGVATTEAWRALAQRLVQFTDASEGARLDFVSVDRLDGAAERGVTGAIERVGPDGARERIYLTVDGGGLFLTEAQTAKLR